MRHRRAGSQIAALSRWSPTGEMHTPSFGRRRQVRVENPRSYGAKNKKKEIPRVSLSCLQRPAANLPSSGIPWDYFNLISNGFLRKGEADENKIAEGRRSYDAALAAQILSPQRETPELIILAGWMYIFSSAFLEPLEKAGVRIINIHPALPGTFL